MRPFLGSAQRWRQKKNGSEIKCVIRFRRRLNCEREEQGRLPFVMDEPDAEYSRVMAHIARRISKNLIGLALGSGAALGLAHIGVLKVLEKEKIPIANLLVITDDIALPVGQIRIRPKGSDGGHNGLKSINEVIGSGNYSRLRFGIGNEYPKGTQVNFVLGKWNNEELKIILPRIELATEGIKDFGLMGIEKTMNAYNSK